MITYVETPTYESIAYINENKHLFRFCLNGCAWQEVVLTRESIAAEAEDTIDYLIADCAGIAMEDVPAYLKERDLTRRGFLEWQVLADQANYTLKNE